MYAAIRQGTARAGMAEELARRIKEGAIPIISDVPGFQAYYVIYAPDDTVTAISIFNNYAAAEESNRGALAWINQSLGHREIEDHTDSARVVSELEQLGDGPVLRVQSERLFQHVPHHLSRCR